MIIAIDGPSGSGKSTVAKKIAQKLDIAHLDTGAMYRLLGYKMIKDNLNLDNISDVLKELNIDVKGNSFYLDNVDVSKEIRENNVSMMASKVSKIKKVREFMVDLQREISKNKSVILDGRDIGTVVFPNADLKIYLNASAEVRAKRRYLEDQKLEYNKILEDIIKRDYEDMNREYSPLRKSEDAIEINTDNLTFDEVLNKILKLVNKHECLCNN
ncbi:(d)CMP kinase [Streptobacillus moniliformis]|uniref:(d)CMP kinase n=1 Tax=Streptobacillus moniliformis TaxID=34105 RepID=UPI0007E39221|nr:(d)CMP kinase [Streptobacillus moniliformis]